MKALNEVYTELRKILRKHSSNFDITADKPTSFYVNTRHVQKNGKPLFFGAVMMGKAYVSYHLFPVYVEPSLVKGISPALKKRMQGKSCFNFSSIDKILFRELDALTKAGREVLAGKGLI